jgi:Tfp pilus assembly protein PilX
VPTPLHTPTQADGSTLLFSLLLLTVMSLLALGAMQGAVVEEKMASNFRFGEATFRAAEAGLQQALQHHADNQLQPSFSGTIDSSQYRVTVSESSGSHTVVSEATHPTTGSHSVVTLTFSGSAGTTPIVTSWYRHE